MQPLESVLRRVCAQGRAGITIPCARKKKFKKKIKPEKKRGINNPGVQHFRRESAGHNKGQNEHSENFDVILLGCQRELEGAAVLGAGGRGDWLSHGSDCSYYPCQLLGDP